MKLASNQKLDLAVIKGLEDISDQSAEACVGGNFTVFQYDNDGNLLNSTRIPDEIGSNGIVGDGGNAFNIPVIPGAIIGIASNDDQGNFFLVDQQGSTGSPLQQNILEFDPANGNPNGFVRVGDNPLEEVATISVNQGPSASSFG